MTNLDNSMRLCPEIAKRHLIITDRNMDSLVLNTYERTPGINVSVSCLVPTLFKLKGDSFITCSANGQWNKPIPKCSRSNRIPKDDHISDTAGIVLPNSVTERSQILTTGSDRSTESVGNAMPYIISVSVLALMFLCLICMMIYLVKLKQKYQYRQIEIQNRPAFVKAVESLQSIPSISSTAYDYYRRSGSPASGSSTRSSRQTGSLHAADTSRSSHTGSPFPVRSLQSNYRHTRGPNTQNVNQNSIRQFEFGRSLTNT